MKFSFVLGDLGMVWSISLKTRGLMCPSTQGRDYFRLRNDVANVGHLTMTVCNKNDTRPSAVKENHASTSG